jgi:hypothetical protein
MTDPLWDITPLINRFRLWRIRRAYRRVALLETRMKGETLKTALAERYLFVHQSNRLTNRRLKDIGVRRGIRRRLFRETRWAA